MVYLLTTVETDGVLYGHQPLDGNLLNVRAVDETPDGGSDFGRGAAVDRGRPVHIEHMPKQVERHGPKRSTPDFLYLFSMPVVERRGKEIIERMEPEVHQFLPVEFVWSDKTQAASMFFLIVRNRIDSVDRAHTTLRFDPPLWEPVPGGDNALVFNTTQIAGRQLWRDKHLLGPPLMSNRLAESLVALNLVGFGRKYYAEV